MQKGWFFPSIIVQSPSMMVYDLKQKMTHGVLSRPARIVLKGVVDYLSMLLCSTLRTESFGHVVDAVQSIPFWK